MVITDRTAQVAQGKRVEALDWAKRITQHLRQKYSKHNVRLAEEVLGDHTLFHWIAEFDSLADVEQYWKALETDKTYQDAAAEQRRDGLFTQRVATTRGLRTIVG
jgi:hypothetical protein